MALKPPPRDANGVVIPHDHEGILPNDGIIRRVSEQHVIFDPKIGGKRLSSSVLNPSSGYNGGLSVDLQQQIEEAGLEAKAFVTTPRWMGSIRFEAGHLRNEGFKVGYDPLEDNPFHGEVWGVFSKSKIKRLLQICTWFVPINDTLIQ
ncbi:MAG: hypothetical protein HOO93_02400 [Methyloglobulus sp.]|nr:hypothetical protein [Methyloglobulus sp.]